MKFLLDVNASRAVAAWLANGGHDAVCVADRDCRMSDEGILEWACRDERIIVTTDRDFEEMIWRESRPHCGVLRFENLTREARMSLLETTLGRYAQDLADGAIVIATRRHVRVRLRPRP